jgi:predicted adenylyl cyclase CyaB
MINLEIKVAAPNLEEIKERVIKIDTKNIATLSQIDTYFLVGKKRLKLREEKDRNYLVYYVRSNKKDSKLSKYKIITIPKNLVWWVKKLFSFIFVIKIIVHKNRHLFMYKNTRIHFDDVGNLGTFVELETVFNSKQNEDDLVAEHNFVIKTLGLDTLEKIPNSYSDLMINKK